VKRDFSILLVKMFKQMSCGVLRLVRALFYTLGEPLPLHPLKKVFQGKISRTMRGVVIATETLLKNK